MSVIQKIEEWEADAAHKMPGSPRRMLREHREFLLREIYEELRYEDSIIAKTLAETFGFKP
jgi:hypothetical protein